LLGALLGAWGGFCVFVGPYFGYRPTSATTWEWTTNNWLLHLLPGAVALVAGLMILAASPLRRAGRAAAPLGLAALLLLAAGAWFVIGPALWPTFQSSPPFATNVGAWTSFWNQLGANLGPGVLLAALAGMALKASIARPAVAVGEAPGMAAGSEAAPRRTAANQDVTGGAEAAPVTSREPAANEYRRADEPGTSPPEET
jgi:hypothetical protein